MEKNFNPEDVDFVKVVEMLDWSSEVSQGQGKKYRSVGI